MGTIQKAKPGNRDRARICFGKEEAEIKPLELTLRELMREFVRTMENEYRSPRQSTLLFLILSRLPS